MPESAISASYLRSVVERLEAIGSHPLGFRVAGTPEEHEAARFAASELASFGLDPVEEPVPVDAWRLLDAYVEPESGPASSPEAKDRVGTAGTRRA